MVVPLPERIRLLASRIENNPFEFDAEDADDGGSKYMSPSSNMYPSEYCVDFAAPDVVL